FFLNVQRAAKRRSQSERRQSSLAQCGSKNLTRETNESPTLQHLEKIRMRRVHHDVASLPGKHHPRTLQRGRVRVGRDRGERIIARLILLITRLFRFLKELVRAAVDEVQIDAEVIGNGCGERG